VAARFRIRALAPKHNGNEPIVHAMNRLDEVERLVSQKIVARESRTKGWTTKSEALEA